MRLDTRCSPKLLIPFVLLVTLVALLIWGSWSPPSIYVTPGARPSVVYDAWAPGERLGSWLGGYQGPRTPLGLLALWNLWEWFGLVVILSTMALGLRFSLRKSKASQQSESKRIALPRHVKLRTIVVLIAIIGLTIAWEIEGGRRWRRESEYQNKMFRSAVIAWGLKNSAIQNQGWADRIEASIAHGEKLGEKTQRILATSYDNDLERMISTLRRKAARAAVLANHYDAQADKYSRAMSNPREPIEPDVPIPPKP
jgi:hypothetical protein